MISDDNKGKRPLEDDLQDYELEEEIKVEEERVKVEDEEKGGEDQSSWHHTTIASIRVVENPHKFKKTARMSTGGKVPRMILAQRTPPPRNKNHFHTLIHQYPVQKIPPSALPSAWDFDRSNNAGNSEFKEEEWGGKSRSWDSPHDILLARVEDNAQLIRNLSHQVEDLMELVEKLIEEYSPPQPKE